MDKKFYRELRVVMRDLEVLRASNDVLFDEWMPHYVDWPLSLEVTVCDDKSKGGWRADIPELYEGDIFPSRIAAELDVAAFLGEFYVLMKRAMEGKLGRSSIFQQEDYEDEH